MRKTDINSREAPINHWFSLQNLRDIVVETSDKYEGSYVVNGKSVYYPTVDKAYQPRSNKYPGLNLISTTIMVYEMMGHDDHELCALCGGIPLKFVTRGLLFGEAAQGFGMSLFSEQGAIVSNTRRYPGLIKKVIPIDDSHFAILLAAANRTLFFNATTVRTIFLHISDLRELNSVVIKIPAIKKGNASYISGVDCDISPDGSKEAIVSGTTLWTVGLHR